MTTLRRLAAALCLAAIGLSAPARAETAKITFLLVNDIYLMGETRMPDGKSRGGFARLAAVVKAERAKGSPVIFAHAGDTLSPSLMSGIDRGAHIVMLTNMIPPDIFVPGNHEFDFGKDNFLTRMGEARFPLYGANLRGPGGQPLPGFKDRAVVTVDGVRIGLTGATADDSQLTSIPGDLTFAPTIDSMKTQAAALRSDGADFVVAVVHADRRQDYALFQDRAADLILTGHDHDLFLNYDGRTAMVESSFDAHYVVAVDVTINVNVSDGRRESTWWPQFRVIDTADVTPDPAVAAAVAALEQRLTSEFDVGIATTEIELDSRNGLVRTREAAIGGLFADAIRASTGAELAIINGGGIRAGKIYQPGAVITRRDVLAELPFGNRVVLMEISGKAIRAGLESGLARFPDAAGGFPQVSGVTVAADAARPAGQRIVTIAIGGVPLDEARIYKLATNDFLARGGDGYLSFREGKQIIRDYDGPLMANEVMAYLRKTGTVRAGAGGRVVFK